MYIFDITTMANYFGRVTGITRVEHMLAQEFLAQHPEDVRFVYWSNTKFRFEEYDGPLEFSRVKAAKQSLDLAPSSDACLPRTPQDLGAALGVGPGDTMIVTGSGWLQNRRYTAGCLDFARHLGLAQTFFIHDLIPIKFPYYYDEDYTRRFRGNLSMIAASPALLACNSENTRNDLLDWCAETGIDRPETVVTYLGDNISAAAAEAETADEADTADSPSGAGFVLAVGAIHRRKNYELLAAVWRRLAPRMGSRCPKLRIVGGVTADGRALQAELEGDPVLRKHVDILWDVDDERLDRLYREADLVVYPSHYEGWGLPVAEALLHGRICLASNRSAIPEIADLGEDFLDPDDPVSWTSRLLYYCQNPDIRTRREAELRALYQPRSWGDTVRALTGAIRPAQPQSPPPVFIGDTLNFGSAASDAWLASVFYDTEPWGRWSRESEIRIRFGEVLGLDAGDIAGRIRLTFTEEVPFRLRFNGQTVLNRIGSKTLGDYHFTLPAAALRETNVLTVEADGLHLLQDANTPSHARRYAGPGLGSLALLTPEQMHYEHHLRAGPGNALLAVDLGAGRDVIADVAGISPEGPGSNRGTVLVQLDKTIPCGEPAEATAALHIPDGEASLLSVRQNGRLIAQTRLVPDHQSRAMVCFDLDPADLDRARLELFLMDDAASQTQSFTLTGLYLPQAVAGPPDPAQFGPETEIARGSYLKFGGDVEAPLLGILSAGWDMTKRFGTTVEHVGILSIRIAGETPVTGLKLNCKLLADADAPVRFLINREVQEAQVQSAMQNVILNLPETLYPGDNLSIRITPPDRQFVLRALELL